MSRIAACFKTVRQKKRGAFIPYIESGDPDYQTALNILKAMPHAGADLIEIGIPFSDPMADGPTVQAAANRSLKAGTNMHKTLQMVRDFRQDNQTTPIILMGYVNPIEHYGYERFCQDAEQAGVDGLIIVDMPHEELGCILPYAGKHHLDVIRLVTPVTPKNRLEKILKDASGFIYYVSITGVTGTKTASQKDLEKTIPIIRSVSDLPIAIGFGISTAEHVQNAIKHADAAVVASALLKTLESTLNQDYHSTDTTIEEVIQHVALLSANTL